MKLTVLKGNPKYIRVETTLTLDMLKTVDASTLKLVNKETKAVDFCFDLRDGDISKYGIGFANAPATGAIVMNFPTPSAAGTDTKSIKMYLGTVAAAATALENQVTKSYKVLEKASEAIEVEE